MIRASRGRAAFLLLLMFAAGVAVGLAGERYAVHRGTESATEPPRRSGRSTIERFAADLEITPEQQAEIDPILVETRERMSAVFDRVRPEWEAVVDSARARIEDVLSPEQVERYRVLLEQQERAGEGDDGSKEDEATDDSSG